MKNTLRKIALVARFEFLTTMRRRSVLFIMFGLPILAVLLFAGINWLAQPEEESLVPGAGAASDALGRLVQGEPEPSVPAGLVDQSGQIGDLPDSAQQFFTKLESVAAAEEAYEAGDIRNYYVIPAGYPDTGQIRYYAEELTSMRRSAEENFLFRAIAENYVGDATARRRLVSPADFREVNLAPTQEREGSEGANFLLGIAIALIFFTTVMGAAGFLLQSLGREKQNRVMEILLSSTRPIEILAGKIIGLGAIGFVQLAIWSALALTTLSRTETISLGALSLPSLTPGEWLIIVAHFLAGYFVYASLFASLGAIAPNPKESSQYTFVLMLPTLVPLWLGNVFWSAPHGALTIFLSLFPLTSPVAMPIRLSVAVIPAHQLILSLGLALLTGAATIYLATRFFRGRTLLSGSSLSLRLVWEVLRAG